MGLKSHWYSQLNHRLTNLGLAMSLFWNSGPWSAGTVLLMIGLEGMIPMALIFATRHVVNTYPQSDNLGAWIAGPVLIYLILLALREGFQLGSDCLGAYHEERTSNYITTEIQNKISDVDMIHFESTEFYDRLHRAGFESDEHVNDVLAQCGSLCSGTITLCGLFWVVYGYAWWFPLMFFAASIPVFLTLVSDAQARFDWSKKMTQIQRKSRYMHCLMVEEESASELRIYGLKDKFRELFQKLTRHLLHARISMNQKQALRLSLARIVSFFLLGFGLIFILNQFRAGVVNPGDMALFGHAILLYKQAVQTMVGESANLYRSAIFLSDLNFVLQLRPSISAPSKPVACVDLQKHPIWFRDISFQYPGTIVPAIDQLNIQIPAQKITLIYGENGSGKSTLAKLLCRFFDPSKGSIMLGDTNLKSFDPKCLRSKMGILFQDPVQYYLSAKENVTLGNVHEEDNPSAYANALEHAQASETMQELPRGDQTLLGRWFQEGIELSGGQWQRLALARLHYADRPIWILDEPTSAMDPWAEHKWLQSMKKDSKGRTVIIITHRIATARIADHVIIMKNGKALESGSPQALRKQNGYFTKVCENDLHP
jgi:ATP-binding cassette, subfamily B, bacterial